jgi:hypothetical protein
MIPFTNINMEVSVCAIAYIEIYMGFNFILLFSVSFVNVLQFYNYSFRER